MVRIEKAILVGVELEKEKEISWQESLKELARLASTAGATAVLQIYQKREKPDPKYFIGKGKVEELHNAVHQTDADLVIFDHSLSPSQEQHLEEALGVKVIDRTELILDIFAQHAHSREGKLQVALAQATFLLTRLTGHGVLMSRLGGGIGTRGPGETKLEYDRRRIKKKISDLKEEIEKVRKERGVRREKRQKSHIPGVALVGYTNAGKSTFLNALTQANVLTQDQLFATLDPTVRRVYLPKDKTILLSDTVGFIQNLPHPLIAAFRATLEEITEADLLLHIVDFSHPAYEQQIAAVYTVLEELNCVAKPIFTLFNKMDSAKKELDPLLMEKYQPAFAVSALTGEGLDAVKNALANYF